MTTTTLMDDPTLRPEALRTELLGDEWLVLDAELLRDLEAWTDGRLQWTPAKAARTVTRADSIDAILEGVRDGRLVPVYRGAVVHYSDALEESTAALRHPSLKCAKLSGSDALARDVVVTLQAQLAAADEWSERLQQSEEAQDFWNDMHDHNMQEAERVNAAVQRLFIALGEIAPDPDSVRYAVQHMAHAGGEHQRLMFIRALRVVQDEMVKAGESEDVTA